LVSLSLF